MTALFGVSPPHFRQRRVIERGDSNTETRDPLFTGTEQRTEKPVFFHPQRARAIIVTKYSFGTSTAAFTV